MMKRPSNSLALLLTACVVPGTAGVAFAQGQSNPDRDCYFGDTHAHSMLSTDAFGLGNRLSPDNAYRFARGVEVCMAAPDTGN